jgi:tetratricopeptide (TPR) repeat protein
MGAGADYTDFTTENTPSVEQELYETGAGLLIDAQKYDEALSVIDKGMVKFPKNTKLPELKGTAYYKSGKIDQFMVNLKEQVAKNPSDKVNWYNLGVLASKDPSKMTEAEGYFKKALEVDPNYIVGLQGIIYNVYIAGDDKSIEAIDAARKAKKNDVFNKLLEERRAKLGKAIPYAEKWYSLEPKNLEIVSLLKGLYQTAHNDAKFQEMKAVETSLKASAK